VDWIEPDWPAPRRVRAACTTRAGGYSTGPFAGLNLADHVGDDAALVHRNRSSLRAGLGLPAEPHWLLQVHGCSVADAAVDGRRCQADASVVHRAGKVCAVLTADCLPLLLCDRAGTRVGAVHAGWRGLADGVVEAAVARLDVDPDEILCWLGPAIGPGVFEVGGEVRDRFLETGGSDAGIAFRPSAGGRWLADLYRLATQRLQSIGVREITGGGLCTYSDPARFFSYRRDGSTGRMASLIWIDPGAG
jgi:YfiH family protein